MRFSSWVFICSIMVVFVFGPNPAFSKTVHYELVATEASANVSGKKTVDFLLLVNNSFPAPTLEFTEGDDAEIVVRNNLPIEDVSVHWHGLLLPPEMDGVPYVNSPPIKKGEAFTFKFKIRQSGTYWYHTHTHVQEQKGLYGAIVIHPKKKTLAYNKEAVAVLSDWSDEDASHILENLRKDGDYYLYKKGTVRSWIGAAQAGALGTYLSNEWTRMGGMDYSDVGYDAFLINGKRESQLIEAKKGDKVRVRIVNAAASSYFTIALAQTPMKVVSADGTDAQPILAKEILIGMAETYDFIFELPENKNYELKITAQDGTGSASTWIGTGPKVAAPVKPFPDMYASMEMDHSAMGGDHSMMDHSKMGHDTQEAPVDHSEMDHSKMGHDTEAAPELIETLTVDGLKALKSSQFNPSLPIQDVKLVLDGDMERYVWHINGKAMFEDRTITITEGQVIRFTFVNNTMMHHPMHLHGHFFRVLNAKGEFSPWKHTVDVPPHMTRTIEFMANEPGDWMLHCHNLYHMKTGMARVVKYSSYTPKPEIEHMQHLDHHLHDPLYFYGMLEAATNHAKAKFRLSQTWNEVEANFETSRDESWKGEGDLFFKRWKDRFTNFFVGGSLFHDEVYGVAGVSYLLPMLVESTWLVTHKGKFRLDLEKRFQWHQYLFSDVEARFRQHEKTEIETTLMFANSWSWAAGLTLTNESLGVGAQVQF